MSPIDESWSAPDENGIVTCKLDVGAVSTLRGRRRRKGSMRRPGDIALWPSAWRTLLIDWLRQGGPKRKWESLLKLAGGERVNEALQVIDSLLKAGLIELEEIRERGRWQPLWVEFYEPEAVRGLLGLKDRTKLNTLRGEQSGIVLENRELESLRASLDDMPDERAVRRHGLLPALDSWISDERSGTRRDFALFARGDTKGISAAEWDWIESGICPEHSGISRHTPALWLRAPVSLITAGGTIDLKSVPDCIGLSPETIVRITAIEGEPDCWRILENRTVFERVARDRGSTDGVIWVPGFAPSWWKKGVAEIVNLSPAPAFVACDPDPAGIEIALDVGRLWVERNLLWEPWRMDTGALLSLSRRKSLNEHDSERLKRLLSGELPPKLEELARWMLENGEKGEQEGLRF